jgi:NADPH2:quinone reductase
MRAIYYEVHGDPSVLKLGELPIPEPGPDQVLVQVVAAGVNPIDRRLRAGELQEYITRVFPVVPGGDLAGRIVKLGQNVSSWQTGDEVVGIAFSPTVQHGSYAEFTPVDAIAIARKPENLSFSQAAALPISALTAWQSLVEIGELSAGESVFIQAGAGGVGSFAVPMAKHLGAKVYTTARAHNTDYLLSRGADHVIDYTSCDYETVLREFEPEGIDIILESLLGGGTAEAAIRLAKDGGAVVYMNNEPPAMSDIAERQIKAQFIHQRSDGKMLGELATLFGGGTLPMPPVECLPLEDAAEAHRRSESTRTRGKLVLEIQDLD